MDEHYADQIPNTPPIGDVKRNISAKSQASFYLPHSQTPEQRRPSLVNQQPQPPSYQQEHAPYQPSPIPYPTQQQQEQQPYQHPYQTGHSPYPIQQQPPYVQSSPFQQQQQQQQPLYQQSPYQAHQHPHYQHPLTSDRDDDEFRYVSSRLADVEESSEPLIKSSDLMKNSQAAPPSEDVALKREIAYQEEMRTRLRRQQEEFAQLASVVPPLNLSHASTPREEGARDSLDISLRSDSDEEAMAAELERQRLYKPGMMPMGPVPMSMTAPQRLSAQHRAEMAQVLSSLGNDDRSGVDLAIDKDLYESSRRGDTDRSKRPEDSGGTVSQEIDANLDFLKKLHAYNQALQQRVQEEAWNNRANAMAGVKATSNKKRPMPHGGAGTINGQRSGQSAPPDAPKPPLPRAAPRQHRHNTADTSPSAVDFVQRNKRVTEQRPQPSYTDRYKQKHSRASDRSQMTDEHLPRSVKIGEIPLEVHAWHNDDLYNHTMAEREYSLSPSEEQYIRLKRRAAKQMLRNKPSNHGAIHEEQFEHSENSLDSSLHHFRAPGGHLAPISVPLTVPLPHDLRGRPGEALTIDLNLRVAPTNGRPDKEQEWAYVHNPENVFIPPSPRTRRKHSPNGGRAAPARLNFDSHLLEEQLHVAGILQPGSHAKMRSPTTKYPPLPPIARHPESQHNSEGGERRKPLVVKNETEPNPTQPGYLDIYRHGSEHEPTYKHYTLREFKNLRTIAAMGGLGPDFESDAFKRQQERNQRRKQYAHQVGTKNRDEISRSPKRAPPNEETKQRKFVELSGALPSKQQLMKEYMKGLEERHKVAAVEEKRPKELQVVRPKDRQLNRKVFDTDALNEGPQATREAAEQILNDTEHERLKRRHEEERFAQENIRAQTESSRAQAAVKVHP